MTTDLTDPNKRTDQLNLLQEVAASGERGRQAFEQSRAAIEAQRQAAVQATLASTVGLNAEQQAAVGGIINPAYDSRLDRLGANFVAGSIADDQQEAAYGGYVDRSFNQVLPALEAELAAKLAAEGGSGRGKKPEEPGDYLDNLKDLFGTSDSGKVSRLLNQYARESGDPTVPAYAKARSLAIDELGIPEVLVDPYIYKSPYVKTLEANAQGALGAIRTGATYGDAAKASDRAKYGNLVGKKVTPSNAFKQIRTFAKQEGVRLEGNQSVPRKYILDNLAQQLETVRRPSRRKKK